MIRTLFRVALPMSAHKRVERRIGTVDDLMREFLTESNENLSRLNQKIVEIEKSPDDMEILNSIFRTIHTIKGTCGFLGLERLGSVAHAAESVLDQARDGRLAMDPRTVTLVLAAVDLITSILEGIEQTEEEPTGDDAELIGRLEALLQDGAETEESEIHKDPVVRSPDEILEEISAAVKTGLEESEALKTVADAQDSIENEIREQLNGEAEQAPEEPAQVGAVPETQTSTKVSKGNGASSKGNVSNQTLRVNVDVLESLMNMVGELVLSRNQLLQLTQTDGESVYANSVQHLNRVTSDVQEAVMKTRMQPIGNAWAKLPRPRAGPQPVAEQENRPGDAQRRDGAGPPAPGSHPGSPDPHRPQFGRPRHRGPRGAPPGRKARNGHSHP